VRAQAVVRLLALFALVLGVVAAGTSCTRVAHADSAPEPSTRDRAAAAFADAEAADYALDLARALAGYEAAQALDPGSADARRAEARAAVLRAHAEGDFALFAELERVRRDPALASDAKTVDALVDHARSAPPGPSRVEVWVLAAEAYAHRLGREEEAVALLRRVVAEPGADPVLARKAARDLVTLLVGRGDLAGAVRAVEEAGPHAGPELRADVARLRRRQWMRQVARVSVVALVVLAGRAVVAAFVRGRGRALWRALVPTARIAVAFAAYVAVSGALLASGYERGTAVPFLALGAALAPLALLARAWALAAGELARSPALARLSRAAVAATATLGTAFLLLDRIDAAFLDAMGL